MYIYWELFWSFVKVGAFCVGGGYASMPLIQAEVIENHAWMTMPQFIDIFTIFTTRSYEIQRSYAKKVTQTWVHSVQAMSKCRKLFCSLLKRVWQWKSTTAPHATGH